MAEILYPTNHRFFSLNFFCNDIILYKDFKPQRIVQFGVVDGLEWRFGPKLALISHTGSSLGQLSLHATDWMLQPSLSAQGLGPPLLVACRSLGIGSKEPDRGLALISPPEE
eukprot:1161262-Pelagomonas_calceolata.AAC.1